MTVHPLVLVDRDRAEQFALLGRTRRLFASYEVWADEDGIAWAGRKLAGHCFAVTSLGPGWVFDLQARKRRAEDWAARRQKLRKGSAPSKPKLAKAVKQLRLGRQAERLLWVIHQRVWAACSSVVRIPDHTIAAAVWGQDQTGWPRQWRQELLKVLEGLTWLHLASWPDAGAPSLDADTALLTHVADLRLHSQHDFCDDDCPERHGPRHHHFLVNVGRGFLGILEQFAQPDDGSGVRTYRIAVGNRKTKGPTLRKAGKTGRLVSVYLPARVGEPDACLKLTDAQHRLLQALVRETTRAPRPKREGKRAPNQKAPPFSEVEVFPGNLVRDFHGKSAVPCRLLDPQKAHLGFNGNGKRRGMGYRLTTPGGWLAKAGYDSANVKGFLDDLAALAGHLGLTAAGLLGASNRWFSLDELRGLLLVHSGQNLLDELHLRVYAEEGYLARWNKFFGWEGTGPAKESVPAADSSILALAGMLASGTKGLRELARDLGEDPSFLSKVLKGKKPPAQLLQKVSAYLAQQGPPTSATVAAVPSPSPETGGAKGTMLAKALAYLKRGWCVVPQETGAKKPHVLWKHLQERRSTEEELAFWFVQWPDAGLAVVLGPVSGLFVIDVDGPEAHAVLLERLGSEPVAPKAISGSGKPFRYHLYFACPDLPTKAKQTPWHEHLEFRGKGGIIVVPPSLHKSGKRYAWVPSRSPDDVPLPEVPPQVLQALQPPTPIKLPRPSSRLAGAGAGGIDASPSTLEFLSGDHSEGPGWNDRLFSAACDLCGREMPFEKAEPLLLAGAEPWNAGEEELAHKSIESAYSKARKPGQRCGVWTKKYGCKPFCGPKSTDASPSVDQKVRM